MAKLEKINGMIWVRDIPDATEYYTEKLGFGKSYVCESDGEIEFVIVERDGVEMHLQKCECDDQRHYGNTFIEVVVDDAKSLADEFEANGAEFQSEFKEFDWGASFKVADPEGNWIMFTKYD